MPRMVKGYGAKVAIVCTCGSTMDNADDLRQLSMRRVCRWCGDRIWPPTVLVTAQAAAVVHLVEPARPRRAAEKS